ncbi:MULTISPECIES: hypothetical protein [unclassified Ruegeria]|uniref:hypothetical protein n=1 Tax=unclassified Ruegeria TaxID=2625375 RepID=UPI001ADBE11D|nr:MULTISPECIES: hypothetical protein [unclassified Ruegeria]MBO9412329.1 hypothetical protein [Ruegeria sp. R8_1]MBO9416433.1 hypothetical protein [Ruegeria sp. R8_2]
MQHVYIDGITDISTINGVVRVTCGCLKKSPTEGEAPASENTLMINMSLHALLQCHAQISTMIKVLEEKEIYKHVEKTSETDA